MDLFKTKKQEVSLSGIIVGDSRYRTTMTGKAMLIFCFRTKDYIYECICWEELAEAHRDKAHENLKVIVRGTYRDSAAKEEKKITANTLAIVAPEPDRVLGSSSSVEGSGNAETLRDAVRRYEDQRIKEGYVKAFELRDGRKTRRWFKQCYCVQDKSGEWWSKIDYAMNLHGAAKVKTMLELRNFGDPSNKAWVKDYRAFLDELIQEPSSEESYDFYGDNGDVEYVA